MSSVYVISHILVALLCFYAVIRAPDRFVWSAGIALSTFLIAGAGFLIERRADWAWHVMAWSIPDLVFLTNLALEGSAVLLALLWKSASGTRQRVRACLLGAPLLFAALWSNVWFFE